MFAIERDSVVSPLLSAYLRTKLAKLEQCNTFFNQIEGYQIQSMSSLSL